MARLMKQRGVPDRLKGTVAPSGKQSEPPIPPQFRNTIRAMTSEAVDGESAGAEDRSGQQTSTPPGRFSSIPQGYRSALIPPDDPSFNVP